ncbi:MAG: hypothetical protein SGPRY_014642, partial [Prymnesium sp.]
AHWFRRLGSPRHVLAPMVDQSEASFRVLCSRHATPLAFTPMISSKQLASSASYRSTVLDDLPACPSSEARPVVAQLAGNDPDLLLHAAKLVQGRCEAVDINLGCPQKIAKRGRYGAWLLEETELIERMIGTLHCREHAPPLRPLAQALCRFKRFV